MRHLRKIFFSASLAGILLAISCTKVGPVPDFEYTYDFDATLPDVDLTSATAETINITSGSVDVAGYTNFSTAISNPSSAMSYAAAANTAFNASQKAYWLGQTQAGILAALQSGDATAQSQVNDAINSFLSNPTLVALLPSLAAAAGSLTPGSGRLGSRYNSRNIFELRLTQFFLVQTQELDDCRQAANDAFDAGVVIIDDLLATQIQAIQDQYNAQLPLIEAQRSALEATALSNHNTRLASYLTLFNNTLTTIDDLLSNGDITVAERDNLYVVNIAVYAASVNTSITLYNSELGLVNTLIAQATANLVTTRDTLLATANTNYSTELNRLTNIRDSTIGACHNQGGTNVS